MDRKQGTAAELRRWHSFTHQQGNQFRSFVQKSSSHRLHVSINEPESVKNLDFQACCLFNMAASEPESFVNALVLRLRPLLAPNRLHLTGNPSATF